MTNAATIALCVTREKNRQMKQRPAARVFAGCFGSRDKSNDRVVEAEHPDLAQNIGRRPRDEKVPSAAGPRSRATRKVKTPRKFEATSAMVLKNIPRLSSAPVRSGPARKFGGSNSVAV